MNEDFWRDRAVAVTGATGFLGSHLTHMLVERGARVVVLVRDEVQATPITSAWAEKVDSARGDIRDIELMERLLGEYEVSVLFHLAAQSQVGVANRNPASTFESNVRGTWCVLEAARRSPQIGVVVAASSDKAYGDQPVLPYTEDMPLLGRHPYDVSKACADLLSLTYHGSFGTPVAVTRCGNLFGPGDTNWQRLIPGTVRSLLRGERPVIRSDGTMTRDYIHVSDGATAYLRVAEAVIGDAAVAGQAFNFSTETPVSVLELVKMIRDAVGSDLEPDVQATARNEIQDQYLSSAKAREMLGWQPQYTLAEGLDQTVRWYRDYLARSG